MLPASWLNLLLQTSLLSIEVQFKELSDRKPLQDEFKNNELAMLFLGSHLY